jgi:hypothetical protein
MMLRRSPDATREWSSHRLTHAPDCIRATVALGIAWVGWVMIVSSTLASGGWVKRHPPYGSGR